VSERDNPWAVGTAALNVRCLGLISIVLGHCVPITRKVVVTVAAAASHSCMGRIV
jgi:hypothetical protein